MLHLSRSIKERSNFTAVCAVGDSRATAPQIPEPPRAPGWTQFLVRRRRACRSTLLVSCDLQDGRIQGHVRITTRAALGSYLWVAQEYGTAIRLKLPQAGTPRFPLPIDYAG